MKVGFHRVDRHVERFRNILQIHFLGKLHQKNGTLIRREGLKNNSQPGHFLPGNELSFGRRSLCLDERSNIVDIDCGSCGALPELKLFRALVIADEVDRDGSKKGVDRGIATEAGTGVVRLEQTILSDGLGKIWISSREGDETKDTGPVRFDKSVDVIEFVDGDALWSVASSGLTLDERRDEAGGALSQCVRRDRQTSRLPACQEN